MYNNYVYDLNYYQIGGFLLDRYIKGLLIAYTRILNLIDAIDPNHLNDALECIRLRIEASINAYKLFSSKELIDQFESEYNNKVKALEGTLTLEDLGNFIDKLQIAESKAKILMPPSSYFNY